MVTGLSSCELIGGIFKAGVWVGVLAVVLVVGLTDLDHCPYEWQEIKKAAGMQADDLLVDSPFLYLIIIDCLATMPPSPVMRII